MTTNKIAITDNIKVSQNFIAMIEQKVHEH